VAPPDDPPRHPPAIGLTAFKVFLDGTEISTAVGWNDAGDQPGPWFINASADNTLNAVDFKGTGMVDELVIAGDVDFIVPYAVLLTLSFNDAVISVTMDGVPVANNGTVETGSAIVIDAADWYEISSVTPASSGSYAGLPVPGALVNISTGIVSATANDTLTIAAVQYSTSGAISTGLGGTLPADKVAAWALANGQSKATLTGEFEVTLQWNQTATIEVDMAGNNFIQAVIQ
jgi:hypothetical protein